MDNEKQLQKCEAEREYQAANEGFDTNCRDEFDDPIILIQKNDERMENLYDQHKEECEGCNLCRPEIITKEHRDTCAGCSLCEI